VLPSNFRTLTVSFAALSAESAPNIGELGCIAAIDALHKKARLDNNYPRPHDTLLQSMELPDLGRCVREALALPHSRTRSLQRQDAGRSRLNAVLLAAAEPSGYPLSTLESSNACLNVSTSRTRTGRAYIGDGAVEPPNHRATFV